MGDESKNDQEAGEEQPTDSDLDFGERPTGLGKREIRRRLREAAKSEKDDEDSDDSDSDSSSSVPNVPPPLRVPGKQSARIQQMEESKKNNTERKPLPIARDRP